MAFPQRSPRPEDHAPSVAPATYQHTPLSNHVRPPRSTSVQSSQAMNTPPRHQMPPGASYPDDMLRHQAEEQQSIYRDPSAPGLHEYEGEEYHNPNPRKRINTEANENPKKRAAVAVSIVPSSMYVHPLSVQTTKLFIVQHLPRKKVEVRWR